MACVHNDFLSIAREYARLDAPEVSQRSSISRAYYAAFHAAKGFHGRLPTPGQPAPVGMGSHQALYHSLSNPRLQNDAPLANRSRSIGYMSIELKHWRERADYVLSETVSYADALDVIAKAEKILSKANL